MEPNLIWRFYLDTQQLWRWQRLRFNTEVAAESAKWPSTWSLLPPARK